MTARSGGYMVTRPDRGPAVPWTSAAADVVARLREQSRSIAVAESLTGGLVCATLTDVPGSSQVLRGGILAYATDLKAQAIGVDDALLAAGGPVQAPVAAQLASGAARLFGADHGLATTGVAGPGTADGYRAGTVYVAACLGDHARVRRLDIAGTRDAVRRATVGAVLALLLGLLDDTVSRTVARARKEGYGREQDCLARS